MLFKLEKPDLSNINRNKIVGKFNENSDAVLEFIQKTAFPEYLYWDKVKYKVLPPNFSAIEIWKLIKFIRELQSEKTIIKSENIKYFQWINIQSIQRFLHEVDLNLGGNLFITNTFKDADKQKMISRGIMEEAIASSQLEGAHTTRKAAKQFLREARKPKNESEQMILNNYQTMLAIENDYKDKKLNKETLFELHRLIAKETIPESTIGRLRTNKDKIVVANEQGIIYHQPPNEDFIKKEIDRLLAFANDELPETSFVHPVVKAILLHFWIGYLHPFVDGNGRIARALFYWYLLKKGYWAFAYLPISTIIKKTHAQYGMAYVYSEQDDLDLTYFIDYNIRKIKIAMQEFEEYLKSKTTGNKKMNQATQRKYNLNERQIQLLQYFSGDTDNSTSLKVHMNIYQVSKKTAITDLKKLVQLNFLTEEKQGKNVHYYGTSKIKELFA